MRSGPGVSSGGVERKPQRVRRPIARLFALTGVVLAASAHVGSPDVWFEGNAGPYPVVVNVQVPGVVPGVAQVYVRVPKDAGVRQVTAAANVYTTDNDTVGSPPPETAEPVAEDPGLYHAPLWIMTDGSHRITVTVRGARGDGQLAVPAFIVATQRLGFDRPLAVGLAVVGVLLFLGIVSITGAMVREAVLAPGEKPDRGRRWRARLVMTAAAAIFGVLLLGGWRWWNAEDRSFEQTVQLNTPTEAKVTSRAVNGVVHLNISGTRRVLTWEGNSPPRPRVVPLWPRMLVPDHGKLMHLFLIRVPDMTMFAHLHPDTAGAFFTMALPSLPGGRYRVFADVLFADGNAQTMTTLVDLPGSMALPVTGIRRASGNTDPDDSWAVGAATSQEAAVLEDGGSMRWEHGSAPFVAGRPASLAFTVTDAAGRPDSLEPYMGMAAHAIIMRDDGTVFVHLHPMGTVSMGAMASAARNETRDTLGFWGITARRMQSDVAVGMGMPMHIGNAVHFPYAFSKPGHYHIWVQVKRAGRVLTGSFTTTVTATPGTAP